MINATDYTPPSSKSFVGQLDTAIRENPVSAALIGMGALWLFLGGSKVNALASILPAAAKNVASGVGSSVGAGTRMAVDGIASGADRAREIGQSVSEAVQSTASGIASTARDALSDTASAATDQVSGFGTDVANASGQAANTAFGIAGTMQSNLAHTLERQPLLLGAIGLALGAGIGAVLPSTDLEEESFGHSATTIVGQAQDLAEQKMETLTSMAKRVYAEAQNEAEHQGLTLAGAKEALSGVGEKLKSVAETARQKNSDKTG